MLVQAARQDWIVPHTEIADKVGTHCVGCPFSVDDVSIRLDNETILLVALVIPN